MRFTTESDALAFIFQSRRKLDTAPRGLDEDTRDISPTRRLLLATGLLDTPREYVVVTGSKGKGSTSVITAKLKTTCFLPRMWCYPGVVRWANTRL